MSCQCKNVTQITLLLLYITETSTTEMIHVMAMPKVQVKQFIYGKIQPTAIIRDQSCLLQLILIGLKQELFNMLAQSMQFNFLPSRLKVIIHVWT